MSAFAPGRYAADLDGDFVVLLIGMRANRPWKVRRWLPVARAMRAMLAGLGAEPQKGLLGYEQGWLRGPFVVQYWRSFDHLERFARDRDDRHVPAWRDFNRAVGEGGDVGIWHETYRVRAGEYEAIYGNMPRIGLAVAGERVALERKGLSAARRIGARTADAPLVP